MPFYQELRRRHHMTCKTIPGTGEYRNIPYHIPDGYGRPSPPLPDTTGPRSMDDFIAPYNTCTCIDRHRVESGAALMGTGGTSKGHPLHPHSHERAARPPADTDVPARQLIKHLSKPDSVMSADRSLRSYPNLRYIPQPGKYHTDADPDDSMGTKKTTSSRHQHVGTVTTPDACPNLRYILQLEPSPRHGPESLPFGHMRNLSMM